jgi:hypothetical protein
MSTDLLIPESTDKTFRPEDWKFPEHWTPSAVDAATNVLTARPDLDGGELSALIEACEMVTLADRLAKVAADAEYVASGSAGQTVLHPAVAEQRLARTAASNVFRALAPLSTAAARRVANLRQGRDGAK